jgi:hypothetical protein
VLYGRESAPIGIEACSIRSPTEAGGWRPRKITPRLCHDGQADVANETSARGAGNVITAKVRSELDRNHRL